jgi:hypothetical protein
MSSGGTDYVDIFIVAVLWGCTNPFLRKGTVEEDEKLRKEQELMKEQCQNNKVSLENGSMGHNENLPLSPKMESSYSYQATFMDDNSNEPKVLSPSSFHTVDYNLYDENQRMSSSAQSPNQSQGKQPPTSFIKGACLQFLSKSCNCSNDQLIFLSKLHPKSIINSFLTSIIYELKKFSKPKIAIPFIFNQFSAIFYFRLIATSDLTNVAYCQAMSMAIEGIVSYLLGERMSDPLRGFSGAAIVTLGVGVCLLSKNMDDNADVNGYYGDRQLTSWYSFDGVLQGSNGTNQIGLFEIAPFVCWFALCGIINGIVNLN